MIIENWDRCTGCGSCLNICPRNAISFIADEKGFLRPVINSVKCVSCGLCDETCPIDSDIEKNSTNTTYAAYANDSEVLNNASSGGIFSVIAENVIRNGGIVYGAGFSDNWTVTHIRCENVEQLQLVKGSKYTQSDIAHSYSMIKKDLEFNNIVLFSGTPCQCAGILTYCKIKKISTDKLITVEILCEGVNSPLIWKEYLGFITKGTQVQNVNFRSKINGWKNKTFVIQYAEEENKEDFVQRYADNYFAQLFSGHYMLRPSCHNCFFAEEKRVADITIGDFWAYDKLPSDFNNEQGISIVLVNSIKGKELFDKQLTQLTVLETDFSIAKQRQSSLCHPTKKNSDADRFWKDYKNKGFIYVLKKYTTYGAFVRLKRGIRQLLR